MYPLSRRLLAGLLLLALPLGAQTPAVPPSDAFSGSIDVRVVNVEAVVTDARGQRVSGLKAGDFRLLVDGRETPIETFAEVGGEKAGTAAGPAAATPAPQEAAAAAVPRGRNLVVFIDESFGVKTHRDVVLGKLAGQLAQLDPADRVAVVAFDGRRLAVLCEWTSDRAALAEVLAAAQRRPAAGISVVAGRRSRQSDDEFAALVARAVDADIGPASRTGESPGPTGSGSTPDSLGSGPTAPVGTVLGDLVGQALYSRMGPMSIAVTAAMRAFANAPGRKLMLLLSGGWPSLSVALPVAGEANRLGYTLYPVDMPGVDTTFQANDASYSGPSPTGTMKDGWEAGAEYTLEVMARATGGKASIDSARLEALPRVLEDTRSYYELSFSPRWMGDDRSHSIRLKVARPGLEVRTRRSYADFSPTIRAKLASEDVAFFGGDLSDRLLSVLAGPPEKSTPRGVQVPFLLSIPAALFQAGPAGRPAADFVLLVQSEDESGLRSKFPETPVHIAATAAGAGTPGGAVRYKVTLPLARHDQRLIFTLRDPASGKVVWGDVRVRL